MMSRRLFENVKVELTDDSLVIRGERKHEHKENHEVTPRVGTELWPVLSVDFPCQKGAKADQAKAELIDGVLKVSVPEAKKKIRQIPVEQGKETKPAAA